MVTISSLSISDKFQFDFIKNISKSDTLPNDWDAYKYYPFDAEYHQSKTHFLHKFSRKLVCELICDKLPNMVDLYIGNDDDLQNITEVEQVKIHAKREIYANIMLALFVPWISSRDLHVSKS